MIQKSDIPETALKYSQRESTISFSQNKRTYVAKNSNKKQVLGFWVDGGLITTTESKKCDSALVVENDLCYLIELKGASIDIACEQLSSTIENFSKNYDMQKFVCRVVVSHYNTIKANSEKCIALKRKLREIKKKYGIRQKDWDAQEKKLEEII